jgi:hypothetical protein
VELGDARIELARELGRVRPLEDAGGDDDVVGLEAADAGPRDVTAVLLRQLVHGRAAADRKLEARRVRLEVVAHLVLRRVRRARRRERHPRQPVAKRRRVEPERVPAVAPRVADPLARVEDDERVPLPLQVVADGEPGLTTADDHCLVALDLLHLPASFAIAELTVGGFGRPDIPAIHQPAPARAWSFLTTRPG